MYPVTVVCSCNWFQSTKTVKAKAWALGRKFLQRIFNRLDKKGDGELTLQDLMDGARHLVSRSPLKALLTSYIEWLDKNHRLVGPLLGQDHIIPHRMYL